MCKAGFHSKRHSMLVHIFCSHFSSLFCASNFTMIYTANKLARNGCKIFAQKKMCNNFWKRTAHYYIIIIMALKYIYILCMPFCKMLQNILIAMKDLFKISLLHDQNPGLSLALLICYYNKYFCNAFYIFVYIFFS